MSYSTVNISPEYSEKLAKLAKKAHRSKTGQLEYLIDKEMDSKEVPPAR